MSLLLVCAIEQWIHWRGVAGTTDCVTDGVTAINDEREEQIATHHYSDEWDEQRDNCELTRAAACYIAAAENAELGYPFEMMQGIPEEYSWPGPPETFKPSEDPRVNLAKAGALIAAAYDRLNRSTQCELCNRWTPNVAMEHWQVLCIKNCASKDEPKVPKALTVAILACLLLFGGVARAQSAPPITPELAKIAAGTKIVKLVNPPAHAFTADGMPNIPGAVRTSNEFTVVTDGCLAFVNNASVTRKTGKCHFDLLLPNLTLKGWACSYKVFDVDAAVVGTVISCDYDPVKP